ncbi:MAG: hypothetical protein RSC18_03210, partial [Raoultibacter sp.]
FFEIKALLNLNFLNRGMRLHFQIVFKRRIVGRQSNERNDNYCAERNKNHPVGYTLARFNPLMFSSGTIAERCASPVPTNPNGRAPTRYRLHLSIYSSRASAISSVISIAW